MTNTERSTPRSTFSRRQFLTKASAGGLAAGVTMTGLVSSTSAAPAIGTAAAEAGGSARSLVCLFLAGGADTFNMFVPANLNQSGSTYDVYAATRGDIAVARNSLLEVDDGRFGFHQNLPAFRDLFDRGTMSVVANVGPLVRPTSPADVVAERQIPQSLFAHDAQQRLWQTASATVAGTSGGWGGAIAAEVAGRNNGSLVPPGISIAGSSVWESTGSQQYLRLHPTSTIQRLGGYDASVRGWIPAVQRNGVASALEDVLAGSAASPRRLEQQVAASVRSSILTTEQLESVTAPTAANEVAMGDYGRNRLAAQLHLVARLIKARSELNMTRQVFFVRMGGWDTHSNQNERLPVLLDELNEAVAQFSYAMGPEGLDVAETVTAFTATDFGRTLTSNGNGTDHGWGGHSFIMGGAVRGGQVVGDIPNFSSTNNPDDASSSRGFTGRIIPSTSVGQYGATIARWMGVEEDALPGIFPDTVNFNSSNIGLFG